MTEPTNNTELESLVSTAAKWIGGAFVAFVGFTIVVNLFDEYVDMPRPQVTSVDQTFMGALLGEGWLEVEAINRGGTGPVVFTVSQNGKEWHFEQGMVAEERKTFRLNVPGLEQGRYSVNVKPAVLHND